MEKRNEDIDSLMEKSKGVDEKGWMKLEIGIAFLKGRGMMVWGAARRKLLNEVLI